MMFIGFVMFIGGLLAFISNRKHTLSMLLSMEFIVLSLVLMMINLMTSNQGYYIMLYFFVFAVCESALGLSLIVILIRTWGSDLILNLSLTLC